MLSAAVGCGTGGPGGNSRADSSTDSGAVCQNCRNAAVLNAAVCTVCVHRRRSGRPVQLTLHSAVENDGPSPGGGVLRMQQLLHNRQLDAAHGVPPVDPSAHRRCRCCRCRRRTAAGRFRAGRRHVAMHASGCGSGRKGPRLPRRPACRPHMQLWALRPCTRFCRVRRRCKLVVRRRVRRSGVGIGRRRGHGKQVKILRCL